MSNLTATINRGICVIIPWFVFLLLPFIYFFSENHAVLSLQLLVAAFSVLLAISGLREASNVRSISTGISIAIMVWFGLLARATVLSVDFSSSFPALIKILSLILLYFVATKVATSELFFRNILRVATFTGLIHGFLAIQEYIEAPPIPDTWIDPGLREHVRTRCAGIFTDPNIFGAFLAVIFLFTCVNLLVSKSFKNGAIASVSLLITGFAELTTLSRGSWIALFMGLLCLVFFARKEKQLEKKTCKVLLLILLTLAAITLLGPFRYRLISVVKSKDMTIAQRTLINKGVIKNFHKFPLTGKGPHTFNQVYPGFRIVGGDYPMNAHNEFIHSMIETGHLSALILFGLFFITMFQAIRKKSRNNLVTGAFASSLGCLFVHNLSGFSSRILPTSMLLSLCAAVTLYSLDQNQRRVNIPKTFIKIFYLVVLVGSLLLALAGLRFFTINSLMIAGTENLQNASLEQALRIFSNVQKLDPGNSIAAAGKADVFFSLGKVAEAKESLQRAIDLNPTEALYWIRMARILSSDQAQKAESFFSKAVALDPASELFRLEFARFLIHQGKKESALKQLDQALKFSPGFHQVYRNYLDIEALQAKLQNDLSKELPQK